MLSLIDKIESVSLDNVKLTILVTRLADTDAADFSIARLLETIELPPSVESDLREGYTVIRQQIREQQNPEVELLELLKAIPKPSRIN